jgi:hypothetical protein
MTTLTCSRLLLLVAVSACATSRFDRHVSGGQWTAAAEAFANDSTLLGDPQALYHAGMLHSIPGRDTYDVDRAGQLLELLLNRFPGTRYRDAAIERLALVNEIRALRAELQSLKEIDLRPRGSSPTP